MFLLGLAKDVPSSLSKSVSATWAVALRTTRVTPVG